VSNALTLPADLPSVTKAKLPASYQDAKTALAECTRIDECQEWADKAEALASYAKQAQDDEMRRMADRIQARAIRRCGELLNAIKAASGARTDLEPGVGTPTRSGAARDAGLSRHQYHTAVRVSRVPDLEFEAAVEADDPLTVTALADKGRMPRVDHLKGRDPADFRAATALLGLLHHIARTADDIDIEAAVRGLNGREIDDALASLSSAENWIAEVADCLRG
jgi:hypothetical protein